MRPLNINERFLNYLTGIENEDDLNLGIKMLLRKIKSNFENTRVDITKPSHVK